MLSYPAHPAARAAGTLARGQTRGAWHARCGGDAERACRTGGRTSAPTAARSPVGCVGAEPGGHAGARGARGAAGVAAARAASRWPSAPQAVPHGAPLAAAAAAAAARSATQAAAERRSTGSWLSWWAATRSSQLRSRSAFAATSALMRFCLPRRRGGQLRSNARPHMARPCSPPPNNLTVCSRSRRLRPVLYLPSAGASGHGGQHQLGHHLEGESSV